MVLRCKLIFPSSKQTYCQKYYPYYNVCAVKPGNHIKIGCIDQLFSSFLQRKTPHMILHSLHHYKKKPLSNKVMDSILIMLCPKITSETIRIRSRNTVYHTATFGCALTVFPIAQSIEKFPKDVRLRIISIAVDIVFVERLEKYLSVKFRSL